VRQEINVKPPVELGEEYDVTIESTGSGGDGVAKINGYVIFVKEAQEGDNPRIKITKIGRSFAIAERVI